MKMLVRLLAMLVAITPGTLTARQDRPGATTGMLLFPQWSTLCEGIDHTTSAAAGDLDGDGDLDLVFGTGRHLPERDWIWSNNGRGVFYAKRPVGMEADPTYAVVLGDVDGNATLDLIVANDTGHPSLAYGNDGHGNFSLLGSLGPARQARRAAATGDFDRDGDLDVVLVGLGQDHLYLNDGTGRRWTERAFGGREPGDLARATGVAAGDVDADGDIDLVVPGRYDSRSLIYLNDGKGVFEERAEFGSAGDDMTSVVLADLNGDGAVDIVAGHWKQPHQVFVNDGRGRFVRGSTFGRGNEQTWSVAVGDMDLDGDRDVVVGNANVAFWGIDLDRNGFDPRDSYGETTLDGPSRVYLNDGRGRLSAGAAVGAGAENTRPVALADLDGDSDLDIVIGNDCQPNRIFWNGVRGATGEVL